MLAAWHGSARVWRPGSDGARGAVDRIVCPHATPPAGQGLSGIVNWACLFVLTVAATVVIAAPAGASATPLCAGNDLQVRDAGGQGALGTFLEALSYRNITDRTCTTYGYPGVTVYSRGRKLTVATREPHAMPAALQVRPGQRVYGVVAYNQTPSGTSRAPSHEPRGVRAEQHPVRAHPSA